MTKAWFENQGMAYLYVDSSAFLGMSPPVFLTYFVASALHEAYDIPIICIVDVDYLLWPLDPTHHPLTEWRQKYLHPLKKNTKVILGGGV